MKKTLTANISGTVFHIEEDAYDTLQRYLGNVRSQFTGTEGRDEIMGDIEARISELLTERLNGTRQVVQAADVDHVMSVMGQPEDFADGDAGEQHAPEPEPTATTAQPRTHKRFFRDGEDKWIGGVIGGLAAYINVEALWLRIGFIVLLGPLGGVLVPIYMLLWILVPKATSSADRLQMRGEPVTVENLKRAFEEGAEKVKEGSERVAKEAKEMGREWQADARKRRQHASSVFSKLVGVALIVFAFALLLSLIGAIAGGTVSLWHFTWSNDDMDLLDLGALLFNSQEHALWFGIGVFLLAFVPIIGLFIGGFRLLLDTPSPKWLGFALCFIWFAALVPTVIGGLDLVREFKRENSVRTEIPLVQPMADVLYVDALMPTSTEEGWSVSYDDGDVDVDLDGLHIQNDSVFGAWAELDVERSADTLFHLKLTRQANGNTAKAAWSRADAIVCRAEQNGDALLVSPLLRFSKHDKFRAQNAHFTLQVPVGKSIFLRTNSTAVIYDIDNVTNTRDHEMVGRTWTMTADGLRDLNAPAKPEDEKENNGAATPDSTRNNKVAAVVWRGPSRKPAPKSLAPTRVTEAPASRVEFPSVLALLGLRTE